MRKKLLSVGLSLAMLSSFAVIPENVMAEESKTLIFSDDFSYAKDGDEVTDHGWDIGTDGTKAEIEYDSSIGEYVVNITSGSGVQYGYGQGIVHPVDNLKGHIIIELKLKIPENVQEYPLLLTTDKTDGKILSYLAPLAIWKNNPPYIRAQKLNNAATMKSGATWVPASYNDSYGLVAGEWYNFRYDLQVGGDTTIATDDVFNFTATPENGGKTVEMGPYSLHQTYSNNNWTWNFENLTNIAIGASVGQGNVFTFADVNIYMSDPTFTIRDAYDKSISNGTNDVQNANQKFVINFTSDMNAETFENITLTSDKDPGLVYNVTPLSGTSSSAVIEVESVLEDEMQYTITVPDTVKAKNGQKVAADKITFTTKSEAGASETIFTDRFDYIFGNSASYNYQMHVGNIWEAGQIASRISYDNDINMYKATCNVQTTATLGAPSRTCYKNSGNAYTLKGNSTVSAKFKFSSNEYLIDPIVFNVDGNSFGPYNYIETLQFRDGKMYALNASGMSDTSSTEPFTKTMVEIAPYEPDTWYDISVKTNVDGDPETFDTYTATISDGKNTWEAGPYIFGATYATNQNWPNWDFKEISYVGFGIGSYTPKEQWSWEIADVKAVVTPSTTISQCTIADGDKSVDVDKAVNMSFTRKMNAATFKGITLEDEKGNIIPMTFSPEKGETKTLTLTYNEPLKHNRNYKLTIPVSVASTTGISVNKTIINFRTEEVKDAFEVSNISCIGALTPETAIDVSADFKNVTGKNESASLIAGIYSKEGQLLDICYENADIAPGDNKTITGTLDVPENIGSGAYVKVFCMDNLQDMTLITDKILLK